MFQFRRFPSYAYLIQHRMTELLSAGFPHSEIHGSKADFASPWLFADLCVLHRLLVPRHSPCALCSLTISNLLVLRNSLDDKFVVIFYPNLPLHITLLALFSFQGTIALGCVTLVTGGLKWTRTTDLTLIRRAL